ncbi:exopolysaccharide biosynthesis polyprenyl glycosylphosphotransferase [Blastococcus sp. DSM 46786]|nr:exopolysaccharide biosynthesis polyprenyl glycosylphosphotransferase [Blastococcus sp. DSM 46786]
MSGRAHPLEKRRVRLSRNTVRQPSASTSLGHLRGGRKRGRKRRFFIRTVLVCADLAAFALAMTLTSRPSWKIFVILVLILVLFHAGGLYRPRLSLSVLDDVPDILGRSLAAGALAMVLGGLNDGTAGLARLVTCALFGVLCIVGRAVAYGLIREARRRGRLRQRALILGAGSVSGELAANLAAHPEYGLIPKGMLDDDPLLDQQERPVPLLGGYEALTDVVLEHRVDLVIVTFGSVRESEIVHLLRACDRLACEILFVPRLFEVHAVTKDTEVLWGMPVVRMRRAPFRTRAWSVKRASDIFISSSLLLALAPVLLLCTLMSLWETRSVVFHQTRVGLDGRPFTLLKFCSMRPAEESEANTHWNIGEDKRLGPFGKVLRRTSLDELPQLWNVLRGDMSLVGPRPERPFFVDEFTRQFPWYFARHRVPVGLTGWAQVHGLRGDTSIEDRARFDNFYIENWSMWGDLKILLRTASQVLRAAGR